MTDTGRLDWLSVLDAHIRELGTQSRRPFPPAPNPARQKHGVLTSSMNGMDRNGTNAGPDDLEQETISGPDNALKDNAGPASPVGPDPRKGLCIGMKGEVGTGKVGTAFPVPTSDFHARVESSKQRDYRDQRDLKRNTNINQNLTRSRCGSDWSILVRMIGTTADDVCDWYEERAAILEADCGLARSNAEALAFAEFVAVLFES